MSLFESIIHNLKKKIDAEQSYKDIVVTTIYDTVGCTLSKDSLSLKNGILYIQTNPVVKMAIGVKKEVLIRALQEKTIKVFEIR